MAELDKKLTEKEAKKVAFTGTKAELRESVAKVNISQIQAIK